MFEGNVKLKPRRLFKGFWFLVLAVKLEYYMLE